MTTTSYQSNRPAIIDSELPAQTSATNGMALISNGASASWQFVSAMIGTNAGQVPPNTFANRILPPQNNNAGKVLITNGSNIEWSDVISALTARIAVLEQQVHDLQNP